MKRCSVGGQAVLEGVMMKTPEGGVALAVRRSDGSIVREFRHMRTKAVKGSFYGLPIVRGVVSFVESLVGGMRITTRSAEIYGDGVDEEPDKFERWLSEKLGKSAMDVTIGVAVVLAAVLAVGLFVFLPSLVAQLIPWGESAHSVWKSLAEGVVRLLIFLLYITCIGFMKDIGRLYQYHGAEHKVIACYEHEAEMTPESAMRFTRLHPRCGTSFLFVVMIVSILVFSVFSSIFHIKAKLLKVLVKLLLLPVVVSISYEFNRFVGRHDNAVTRALSYPGMALQNFTTNEPDDSMLEVAIRALELVLPEREGDDRW